MISDFISLFYPKVCLTCGGAMGKGLEELCVHCLRELPKTENHKLEIPEFREKFSGIVDFKDVFVYLFFQKRGIVQKLLHEIKYNHRFELAEMLGRWYGQELKEEGHDKSINQIIPIPLHKKRLKERGYNQSEHFGIGLSEALERPILSKVLLKTRPSESQTNKSRMQRGQNVEGTFSIAIPEAIRNQRVLLVDDVLTTGATLVAAARPLLEAGAKSVSFAVVAAAK